jgi:hypothetical protein
MKKYIFTLIFIFLIVNCLIFPQIARKAAECGIITWFYQILPSLLPFTILSGIFLRSKWMDSCALKGTILPISIIMCCGIIFGFPIGAKLSADFYMHGYISKPQAEILCVCTNQFGPMYVNSFVIPFLFGTNKVDVPLLLLLYLAPTLLCIIRLLWIGKREMTHKKSASRFQLDMQIIDAGIISGFETLIKICGYIVLFSLVTSFCNNLIENHTLLGTLLLGNLEISNGIALLSNYEISQQHKYIIVTQLLSFGGISGVAQTASFLKLADLSTTQYLLGKIGISVLLSIIACMCYL